MIDFIKRLEDESEELDLKLEKLSLFILDKKFANLSEEHQKLLLSQQGVMARYLNILNDRLCLLRKGKK